MPFTNGLGPATTTMGYAPESDYDLRINSVQEKGIRIGRGSSRKQDLEFVDDFQNLDPLP